MKRHMFAGAGVATTLAVVLLSAAGSPAQVTVKGDAMGWNEIKAGWRKLLTLKSYRMKIASEEASGTMSVVAPDRLQVVMTAAGATSESITVGQETRFRQGKGPWRVCEAARALQANSPRNGFAVRMSFADLF